MMLSMVLIFRRGVIVVSLLSPVLWSASSLAQWAHLSQPQLRAFAEDVIQQKKIWVDPPEAKRIPMGDGSGRRRLEFYMGDFQHNLSGDSLFDRALNAQLQVSLIREYRNRPIWRRDWAPYLQAAENQIAQMLAVCADPNLSAQQKDQALAPMEMFLYQNYQRRLDAWCNSEPDIGEAKCSAKTTEYNVFWTTSPPGGVLKYVSAGRWALYQYANSQHLPVPVLEWQTPSASPVPLVGKYYFYACFNGTTNTQPELVPIIKETQLKFTPKGLEW